MTNTNPKTTKKKPIAKPAPLNTKKTVKTTTAKLIGAVNSHSAKDSARHQNQKKPTPAQAKLSVHKSTPHSNLPATVPSNKAIPQHTPTQSKAAQSTNTIKTPTGTSKAKRPIDVVATGSQQQKQTKSTPSTKRLTVTVQSTKPKTKSIDQIPEASVVNQKAPDTQNHEKTQLTKKSSFYTIFNKILAVILGASTLFFIVTLSQLNMLPALYFVPVLLIIALISTALCTLLWRGRIPKLRADGKVSVSSKLTKLAKIPAAIIAVAFACVYLVAGSYIAKTSGFLDNLKGEDYISEQYLVIVKDASDYTELQDLKDHTIGTFDEGIEVYQEALQQLESEISTEIVQANSAYSLIDGLLADDYAAIFISAAYKGVLDEENSDFAKSAKVIHTIEIKVKIDNAGSHPSIDVATQPFTIYISGIDSYGDLTDRGLSDVNMLATINPITHEILLTSIPRDCYVYLHGMNADIRDKLTHAGLYGVQMSIQTIEDLLGIKIDYYIKINFTALIGLVDTIGGIDVYSDKRIKPLHGDGNIIEQGMNHLNGKMALAFARERMSYTYGDRHRVQNQRDVLNAIIKKISTSTVLLTRTNDILNNLSANIDTNISKTEISSLVKLQLEKMPSWQVGEYMLDGSDLYTHTYTFNDQLRYVLVPFDESIKTARDNITGVLEGKSFSELGISTK